MRVRLAALIGMFAALLTGVARPLPAQDQAELPLVRWNDNERPAGTLAHGVLSLELELVRAGWRYVSDMPPVTILAFRESGGPPENPGPLIRVPLGSQVDVTIRNPLPETLVVHGLSSRKTGMDSLVVAGGATARVRFTADAEGTYYYWGTTTGVDLAHRVYEDSQLHGALIVDPPGTLPRREKVMIMAGWFDGPDEHGEPSWTTETMVINGRSWPHTERLAYDLGDTVRWRVLNLTDRGHPMHLHGFYFRIDAKGDNRRDEIYWPVQRRMAATERFALGETAMFTWVPDRPGGWVFHCHISWHVAANAVPGQYAVGEDRDHALLSRHEGGHDPHRHVEEGMGGLMMGIQVRPPEGWRPDDRAERRLRIFVVSDSVPGERRRFGYAAAGEDGEPPAGRPAWPGPTIVAWKNQPTSVTVINRSGEPTAVHWHGLELDSYYDGVAGIGGYPDLVTPSIVPGDSFTMHITPPRAGTFMYHTHVHDVRQQSAGLYAPFVVLEEGEAWDPERDRTLMLSAGSDAEFSPLLNGKREPAPVVLRAGTTYRLRLMNISLHHGGDVRLVDGGYPVLWTPLAEDGFDIPAASRRPSRAELRLAVGKTYDFAITPQAPTELVLEFRDAGKLFLKQVFRIEEPPATTASAGP